MTSDKETKEAFKTEIKAFVKGLLIIFVSMGIAMFLASFIGIVVGIIAGIFALIIAFLVLYLVWAPNNVFANFPEEGYATIIVRGQGFRKIFLKKEGFGFDNRWNIVENDFVTKKQRDLLGMCFFLWPFERVYVYRQRWVKYTEEGESVSKEEVLKNVLVKSYVFYIGITSAEDKRNMPIDIGLAVEMRVFNPYKAMFNIEKWHRAAANFIQGEIRDQIRTRFYDDWIQEAAQKSLGNFFQEQIREIIEEIEERFGVEILKIKVVQIQPSDKKYVEASTRKAVAEFEKQAIEVEAQARSYKRAKEAMGPIMDMLKQNTGLTEEQIQEQIRNNPNEFLEKYGTVIKQAEDMVHRQMAIEGKQFADIRVPGGSGSSVLLEAIAAIQILGQQMGKQASSGSGQAKNLSREERIKRRDKSLGLDED